ncbi:MAG: hypothetical protein LZF60_170102 [Nitrospira sp.]|nr:MAG: hypothetical protein LZF60_170102 [Nitrospira sp.]
MGFALGLDCAYRRAGAFTIALTLHRLCLQSMVKRHEGMNWIHLSVWGGLPPVPQRHTNDTLWTHFRLLCGICRVDIRGQGWVLL